MSQILGGNSGGSDTGDVSSAGTSTANDITVFADGTGKLITDSGISINNVPTTDEAAALVGTSGAPSGTNPYVTNSDPRLSGASYLTALTGDVTASGGGSQAATVARINGATLGTTTASSGNILIGSGSAWVTNPVTGDVAMTSAGVTNIGIIDAMFFGDGSDGDVTINSGLTSMNRDMYYHNLTISGTGTLDPNGWRVFVSGTLDISAAGALSISRSVGVGGNGSVPTGGNAGTSLAAGTLSGATAGVAGGAGSATSPTVGGTGLTNIQLGGGVGAGAAGGTGGAGSAGVGAPGGSVGAALQYVFRRPGPDLTRGASLATAVLSNGAGGGGGNGNSAQSGGGGGGSGGGGPVIGIWARTINRGGSTAASAISAKAANGGNGASAVAANAGGGGGGAGGSGGWIFIVYRFLTGSTGTNILDASGGNGGAGGNGTNNPTGAGGNGGVGGGGGTIQTYNLSTQTWTITNGSAGSSTGTTHSGITGGSGGAGNTIRASL